MSIPRLSLCISHEATESELTFASQIGADCVFTWVPIEKIDRGNLVGIRRRVEDHGLTLHNVGCIALGKNDSIHLNLPGRDKAIAQFREFVANLGDAGIGITTFTWEPDGVWSSSPGATRGARARSVYLDELTRRPFTHDRVYEREELWDNYAYFIEAMSPGLRDAGVRLAMHPNDPPTGELLGGIPCLIRSVADYDRAFAEAEPEILGMELCCGCWLEGGEKFGDPIAAIHKFCREERVLIVHFRNVSSPMPRFTETFLDNGYADMYLLMRALVEAGYANTATPDHMPMLAEPYGHGSSVAYAVGYMRALIERARDEFEAKLAQEK